MEEPDNNPDYENTDNMHVGREYASTSGKNDTSKKRRRGKPLRPEHQSRDVHIAGHFATPTIDSRLNLAKKTGLVYDAILGEHECAWNEHHSENPKRISRPYERCAEYGLISRCRRVEVREASVEELELQHDSDYINLVESSCSMNEEELKALSEKYDSVYFHPKSYINARLCLGGILDMVDDVITSNLRNGIAIVRPPGHHAMIDEACGYSYFNSVAIAAKHAQQKHGLKKILIVDWDVHHGQGTQRMFYDNSSVLYISIHRYEHGSYWPCLRESEYDYVGQGKAAGYNINIPLNQVELGDDDYISIFHQIILPVAYEFSPDLVLVSAGYDAAIGDEKGEMRVSPSSFALFTHMLMGLADGRVCLLQEGGYCLDSLSESIALTLRTLLGDALPAATSVGQPHQSCMETILNVITVQRPYWKCFQFQNLNDAVLQNPIRFLGRKLENKQDKFDIYEDLNRVYDQDEINNIQERLKQLTIDGQYLTKAHRTCLVYDERMRAHRNHVYRGHPERPDRISRIYQKHVELKVTDRCLIIQPRFATKDELETCHSLSYIEEIDAMSSILPRELHELEEGLDSVYLTQEAFSCASLSCGCLLNVVDSVLSGQSRNGVAIVRPPGHHAEPQRACGFCFFNNVSVAARYAQNKFGLKRILILDWDIHHGNGTQRVFESDPSVLYMSIHRYDEGGFFPGSDYGNYYQVGSDNGQGFTVNVAWNKKGMGDGDYIAAFQQVIMPIARQYNPELVLVSAGFDAARGDPLGRCNVSPACYAAMTHMLSSLAHGRVVLALEGGYNLTSISECMTLCTCILLGDQCPILQYHQPSHSAVKSICDTLDTHKQYWSSLQFRANIKNLSKSDYYLVSSTGTTSQSDTSASESITADESSAEFDGLVDEMKKITVKDADNDKQPPGTLPPPGILPPPVALQPPLTLPPPMPSSPKILAKRYENANGNAKPTNSEHDSQDFSSSPVQNPNEIITNETVIGQNDEKTPKPEMVENKEDEKSPKLEPVANPDRDSESMNVGLESEESMKDLDAVCGGLEGACGGAELADHTLLVNGQEAEGFVVPLPWCPHVDLTAPMTDPSQTLDAEQACGECGTNTECWLCLTCYQVYCGRFVNEHMLFHGIEHEHYMVLSYADLSIWCYGCNSYVNNEKLFPMKRAAYISKFKVDVPCYF